MSHSIQDRSAVAPTVSAIAQSTELRYCSNCHSEKFAVHFVGRTQYYHTCANCGACQSNDHQGAPPEATISLEMFVDFLLSRDSNNESDLDEVEIGYLFHGAIAMDVEMCAMNDDAIINLILSHIKSADGYSGRITGEIDRRNHQVMVDIQHDVGHCGYAVEDTSVLTIVREYIQNNARRLDATALFEQIKAQFPDDASHITQAQVYYWWCDATVAMYRRHDNQMRSCEIILDEAASRGFNKLFGVVAAINGVGFPVAYLLLDVNSEQVDPLNEKKHVIRRFFSVLRQKRLMPTFFFTDKDAAQIYAIEAVWGTEVLRLCLWHLDRSVKLKLAQQKLISPPYDVTQAHAEFDFVSPLFLPDLLDRSGQICSVEHRNAIAEMTMRHYHLHPMIGGEKALLLMDNGPSHTKLDLKLKNIEIYMLPPNTTAHYQLLDADIICNFKLKYKATVLRYAVIQYRRNTLDSLFKIGMKQALNNMHTSWRVVTAQTTGNCWKHTGLFDHIRATGLESGHELAIDSAETDEEMDESIQTITSTQADTEELLKFAGYKARAEREWGSGQNDGDVYNVAKDLFLVAEERSLDFEKGKASSAESGNDGAEGSDARPAGRKQQKLLEERKRKWDEIHEKNIEQNDAFLVEMHRKNMLLQELKENAIMSVNMSTLTDMQRAYYEHMQKEIMEKRNIAQ
ncbi:hypothetical protein BX666DRAFT_2033110 [Dichotomocladium elegans]|nr:hypothetical protein BX666DRAFT_2033110 [Dichotomocladium elegans]